MSTANASRQIERWPMESRQAAQLVINQYGEPDEMAESQLIWHRPGPWKRIVASKACHGHNFPAPHYDSVESVIDYRVPPEKCSALAAFDGSVIVERTAGEVSARCHDEQANFLALNLMHDIVTGAKTVEEARAYYAKEFADYRRKRPTPYMEKLRFAPAGQRTADPDVRVLSDEDIAQATREGQEGEGPSGASYAEHAEAVKPLGQGRVSPVRSRDEANIDSDEALPSAEEERSIADNLSREEIRHGSLKPPRP